jgi:hypothetical protein
MRAVLGHETPDEERVAPRLEAEAREVGPGRDRHRLGAVRDVVGCRPVPREVVRLHPAGVGDHALGTAPRPPLRGADEPAGEPSPLLPLPVEPVHVQDNPLPSEARDPAYGAIADIEIQGDVIAPTERVQRGQQAVRQGVEVLAPDRRQLDEAHALVGAAGIRHVGHPAVDGDGMAPSGEASAQLLGARLEAAVAGGYAASSEHCDAQRAGRSRHGGHCHTTFRGHGPHECGLCGGRGNRRPARAPWPAHIDTERRRPVGSSSMSPAALPLLSRSQERLTPAGLFALIALRACSAPLLTTGSLTLTGDRLLGFLAVIAVTAMAVTRSLHWTPIPTRCTSRAWPWPPRCRRRRSGPPCPSSSPSTT